MNEISMEHCLEIETLKMAMAIPQPVVEYTLTANSGRTRANAAWGVPAQFYEGDLDLVARGTFPRKEKLGLRWRGPRRVTKVTSGFIF